jgi:hypothetical protein
MHKFGIKTSADRIDLTIMRTYVNILSINFNINNKQKLYRFNKGLKKMNKTFGIMIAAALFAANINAERANDGTNAETVTIGIKSKYPFVDRNKMIVRGHIEYSVPKQLNDNIEIADARGTCDLITLMKFVNKVEAKNEEFKQGKGVKRKHNNSNWSPPLYGNIDSILIAKNGKLILEEYFADANMEKPHYQMSVTKSITSNAIGKLIYMGKI